jgi:hypothetical protein
MNKIIFDMNLKDPSHAALRAQLALPPPDARPVRYRGTIPTAPAASAPDFQKLYAEFCFNASITKPEVVAALIKINGECIRVLKLGLFNTLIPKVGWGLIQWIHRQCLVSYSFPLSRILPRLLLRPHTHLSLFCFARRACVSTSSSSCRTRP